MKDFGRPITFIRKGPDAEAPRFHQTDFQIPDQTPDTGPDPTGGVGASKKNGHPSSKM